MRAKGQLMHEGRRNGGVVFSDDAAGDAKRSRTARRRSKR